MSKLKLLTSSSSSCSAFNSHECFFEMCFSLLQFFLVLGVVLSRFGCPFYFPLRPASSPELWSCWTDIDRLCIFGCIDCSSLSQVFLFFSRNELIPRLRQQQWKPRREDKKGTKDMMKKMKKEARKGAKQSKQSLSSALLLVWLLMLGRNSFPYTTTFLFLWKTSTATPGIRKKEWEKEEDVLFKKSTKWKECQPVYFFRKDFSDRQTEKKKMRDEVDKNERERIFQEGSQKWSQTVSRDSHLFCLVVSISSSLSLSWFWPQA